MSYFQGASEFVKICIIRVKKSLKLKRSTAQIRYYKTSLSDKTFLQIVLLHLNNQL